MSNNAALPASTLTYPAASVAWRATAVLYVFYLVAMLDRFVITLLQKPIKADLALSDVQLSLLFGVAFAASYVVTVVPFGWAVDRLPRRWVMYSAISFWSLATAAAGLVSGFYGLLATRAAVGAGESGVTPASHSILADMFRPDKLSLPLSIWALGAKTGEAFSLFIGGLLTVWIVPGGVYLLGGELPVKGWQLIFICLGLPGLLLAFLIFTIPEPARHAREQGMKATFGEYVAFVRGHWRFFTGHHAGTALIATASLAVLSWSPAFFERQFGLSTAQTAAYVGVAILVGPLAGLPLHGALTDLLFRRGYGGVHLKYQAACALLSLPLGVVAFTAATPLMAAIFLAALSFTICGYLSLPACALQLIIPVAFRGRASAIFFLLAGQFATAVGPISVALFTDHVFGSPLMVGRSVIAVLAITLPTAAALLALAFRGERGLTDSR